MKKDNETIDTYIKRKRLTHKIVAESMEMQITTWYKNRLYCCKNVSIEEIHKLSMFLKISPNEAFKLVYNHYQQHNTHRK